MVSSASATSGECVATVRSVGAVSVRAWVRPRPSKEWSMMMVPTYPEDGSRALKVYQHQHHGWAGRAQSACRQRSEEQLSRDCVGRFGWDLHGKTARSALYLTVKVAGGGTSVHGSGRK